MKDVTLGGVEVIDTTEKAVLIAWTVKNEEHTSWVPRSLCLDGDTLNIGDTDVCVAKWFANKEDLPWEG